MVETEYFGGIARHMWMWSIDKLPSITSTPLYSHSHRRIAPISFRSFPNIILRRFFGTQTTWYLHSQTVCDKLFFTFSSFPIFIAGLAPAYYTEWSFFVKYYSIAFATLPGVAGGLALELINFFEIDVSVVWSASKYRNIVDVPQITGLFLVLSRNSGSFFCRS